jgi:uncharacterized protein (TIGR02679 family)
VSAPERLQRLLGGSELAGLRIRLRRRYERGADGAGSGTVHLERLTEMEHAALAGILGRPPRRAASMTVEIAALDTALERAGLAASLRAALEMLDGPIVDKVAERHAMEQQWQAVRAYAAADDRVPLLRALLAESSAQFSRFGLLKRLAGGDPASAMRLCELAQRVMLRLPALGVPRSKLAADALGDAHGLDEGQPVATLVLAALKHGDAAIAEESAASAGQAPERARDLWSAAGVLVNELARPALFLNLPGAVVGMPDGEPGYLSLRALLRAPRSWPVAGRTIYVCENPNIVAIAADALGTRCAPLVCTDGMPAAAQRTLLRQLAAAGARLRYHGDYDVPGVHIGNVLMREFGALPWRFGAREYIAAVKRAQAEHDGSKVLEGEIVEACWDAGLGAAMLQHGRAIDEETVVDDLLTDLCD